MQSLQWGPGATFPVLQKVKATQGAASSPTVASLGHSSCHHQAGELRESLHIVCQVLESNTQGSVLPLGVSDCPIPCLPGPCGSSTSGLSAASAGSQWQEDSACGTAGNAEHEVAGCCWVGRGLCTTTAVPSPAPHCTCGKRTRVTGTVHPGATPSVQGPEQTHFCDSQNQAVLFNVAICPYQVIQ